MVVRAPLTLDQLIEQLILLRARHPEQGARPVHLLDTDDDGDGLVTDVDLDCFDAGQGPVTSVLSSPPALTCAHNFRLTVVASLSSPPDRR
ncbi:MAG: hypothetical protein ACRDRA_08295 [Pseudonocardiaceae bacterium]